MNGPGRSCPLDYRTLPRDLAAIRPLATETAYVIGGLYGNLPALQAIQALALQEIAAGLPPPRLVFNGDFNWFNIDALGFSRINHRVLAHTAIQGNVEAELVRDAAGAGCGCAYPDWVDDATVAHSNRIMARLQATAQAQPALQQALAALPRQLRLAVGGLRIGVVHGDPTSLAGWGLALENMPAAGVLPDAIRGWFQDGALDVLASSHTCLPFMQGFQLAGQRRLVMNNGAAGMPNFRGDLRGLISRISVHPSPHAVLYGTALDAPGGAVYCGAVAVSWDQGNWLAWFDRTWPAGSAAAESYRGRLTRGPAHCITDADRL